MAGTGRWQCSDQSHRDAVSDVDPVLAHHGKVSYLEIPAVDLEQSAAFYEAVFGWNVERRDAGNIAFSDGTGEIIGRWISGRSVSSQPGILPYIYVNDVEAVRRMASRLGGYTEQEPYAEGNLRVARLRDPAGNVIGIWQDLAR
jgi:uncharacterized protein